MSCTCRLSRKSKKPPKLLVESTILWQVVSVYMDVDIQDHYLNIIFFITFVWCCATFAVVFYGVDSVDLAGKVDQKNKENFQWINVSKASFFCLTFWLDPC